MDGGYLQIQKQDSAIKDFSKKGNLMGSGYWILKMMILMIS